MFSKIYEKYLRYTEIFVKLEIPDYNKLLERYYLYYNINKLTKEDEKIIITENFIGCIPEFFINKLPENFDLNIRIYTGTNRILYPNKYEALKRKIAWTYRPDIADGFANDPKNDEDPVTYNCLLKDIPKDKKFVFMDNILNFLIENSDMLTDENKKCLAKIFTEAEILIFSRK